jgi:carbonic anhydrase
VSADVKFGTPKEKSLLYESDVLRLPSVHAGPSSVSLSSGDELRCDHPVRSSICICGVRYDKCHREKAANEKYVSATELCSVDLSRHREQVAQAQTPWATILTCSDSRVPHELLFADLKLGELFVARNAGNIVDTDTMGTIEYGAEHLGIPVVVVLGHERCGAVSAACAVVEKQEKFPGSIGPMVNAIFPVAKAVYGKPGDFVDNTVRESAKRTVKTIATKSQIVSHLIKADKVKVLAARYDLHNGRVEFLTS